MCARPQSLGLLAALWLLIAPVSPTAASGACPDAEPGAPRASCLAAEIEDAAGRLAEAESRVEGDPRTTLALLDTLDGDGRERAAPERAWLLELRARALGALSRHADSADAWSAAVALDDGTERLSWLDGRRWTAALDTGDGRLERAAAALERAGRSDEAGALAKRAAALGAQAATGATYPGLLAPAWRDYLPSLSLPMFGGRSYDLDGARGKVLVLDFWATWCTPCVRELPFLDELYRERRAQGLEVVAVNYQEAPDEAVAFAESLGLSLPIAMATFESDRHFKIQAMPTVIVADRDGGVRARWYGYEQELREEITSIVDILLAEQEAPAVPLGVILEGADLLRVDWTREAREPVQGIGVVPGIDGRTAAAAALKGSIDLFTGTGHLGERLQMPAGSGKLRAADVDGDGVTELFTFRPGGTSVMTVRADGSDVAMWEAPAPVFDLAIDTVPGTETPLLLATLDGTWRATRDGKTVSRIDGTGGASSLGRCDDRPWALETSSRLLRFNAEGAAEQKGTAPEGAWTLICSPGSGAGVAGFGVTSVATGRFLDGSSTQAALGLASGQLVLVDLDGGTVRYRARLDAGVTDLAAGDFDGDGRDELLLATGKHFALLRGADRGQLSAAGAD